MNLNSRGIINYLLLPLSLVFYLASRLRFLLYKYHIFKNFKVSLPLIVVGNITVGGSGKTPVVIAITHYLQQQGYKVGVISRGYGRVNTKHILVDGHTKATQCGDEPLLIYLKTDALVSVSNSKKEAIQALEDKVDIIISDDGLQHYSMPRNLEIIVYNGIGNGWYLPAGPLREGKKRLENADIILTPAEYAIVSTGLVDAITGKSITVEEFHATDVYAVCGIGNPERFFSMLSELGISHTPHPYPDHYQFTLADFNHLANLGDDIVVITTAKDWVKYKEFITDMSITHIYYLAVDLQIADGVCVKISHLLNADEVT